MLKRTALLRALLPDFISISSNDRGGLKANLRHNRKTVGQHRPWGCFAETFFSGFSGAGVLGLAHTGGSGEPAPPQPGKAGGGPDREHGGAGHAVRLLRGRAAQDGSPEGPTAGR